VRALLDAPDPAEQLAGFVAVAVDVNRRVAPVHRVLLGAADTDPEPAALLAELTEQRQRGQRMIARSLARAGALRQGVRERDAADVIHALLSPELYRLLVVDRGWSLARYQSWLEATLAEQILSPSGT
jgi:hypothetical protein